MSRHAHTRKLPWPCSKVDRDVLHELWLESQETGQKITEIVANAITARMNQRLKATSARAAEPSQTYHAA